MRRRIKTRRGELFLDDDGIIHYTYDAGAVIDEAHALEDTRGVQELGRGQPFVAVVDLRPVKRVSAAARKIYAATPGAETGAMIVGGPVSRVIGNFFLGINRPRFTLRLFNDEQKALDWLREHLPSNGGG